MVTTGYCSKDIIRQIAGITVSQISDEVLTGMVSFAVPWFNAEFNVNVGEGEEDYEELLFDENDSTDTIRYTQHRPLGDRDGDGSVTTADITVYDDMKLYSPSTINLASVDATTGKITLAAANTDTLYAKYSYLALPLSSQEIQHAFAFYVAMLCMDRLIAGAEDISIGSIAVQRKNFCKVEYEKIKQRINNMLMMHVTEPLNKIPKPEQEEIGYDWGNEE